MAFGPKFARGVLALALLTVIAGCGRPVPEGGIATDTSLASVPQQTDNGAATDGTVTATSIEAQVASPEVSVQASVPQVAVENPVAAAPVAAPTLVAGQLTAASLATPGMAGAKIISDQQLVTPVGVAATATAEPTPDTQPPAGTPGTYIVESGDTLSVIAERHGVRTSALAAANGIGEIHSIKPGQELIIPAP